MSLGGSVIVPENIDVDFLNSFKKTIENYANEGHKFVIFAAEGK